jgi:hypothetical protein
MGDNTPTVLEVFDGFMKGFVGDDYDPILEENQGGHDSVEDWAEEQLRKRGEHPDQKPSTADLGGSVDFGEGVEFPERPKPEDFDISVDNEARDQRSGVDERGRGVVEDDGLDGIDAVEETVGNGPAGSGGGKVLTVDQLYEQNRITPLEAERVEREISGDELNREDILRLQDDRVIEGNLKHRLLDLLEAEGVETGGGVGQTGRPVTDNRSAVSDGPDVSDVVQKLQDLESRGELSEVEKQQILKALGIDSGGGGSPGGRERDRGGGRDPDVEKLDEMLDRFRD